MAVAILLFLLLALVLGGFERLRPDRRQPFFRKGWGVDAAYWFFNMWTTRVLMRAGVVGGLAALVLASGVPLQADAVREFLSRPGRLAGQPAWLQVAGGLLLGDLMLYWLHRAFHRGRLWPFHAVHHSSTEVDWLSGTRFHPVNDVLVRLPQVMALYLMGYSPKVLAAVTPFVALHSMTVHANVPWDYGPLRGLIASPRFHRWHHTTRREGMDKNFAGLFPFIDMAFGTYYMPADRRPDRFGIEKGDMPDGLLGQLAYPFRRKASHG